MEHSPSYALGFLCGLLFVAVFAFLIGRAIRKKNGGAEKYDERQQLVRGRAYQAAFWTLIGYLVANGLFVLATGLEWADMMTSAFVGICLAITVFVVVCIQNDAYFAVNQKPGFYIKLFIAVIAVNLGVLLLNVFDGTSFFTDGRLNYHAMNGVIVAMFLVVLTALAARRLSGKRAVPEADDE